MAAAVLAGALVATGCRSGGGATVPDDGQLADPARSVRFVAVDGSLGSETVEVVEARLELRDLVHLVESDDVGLTITIDSGEPADAAPLARLATTGDGFAVAPVLVEAAGPCPDPTPGGPEHHRDLRAAAGTAACWPVSAPVLTGADVVGVGVPDDQPAALVVEITPAAASRFSEAAEQLLSRRLAVVVGDWVVSVPTVRATEYSTAVVITLASAAEATLAATALDGPPLPEALVEPVNVAPSGFGPSSDGE